MARADGDAVAVYAADKVAKARELRMTLARRPNIRVDPGKLRTIGRRSPCSSGARVNIRWSGNSGLSSKRSRCSHPNK